VKFIARLATGHVHATVLSDHHSVMTRGITIISVSLFVTLSSWNPQSAAQPLVVSEAEVVAGVKKYIYAHAQKSADKKFHVQFGGKDVALDLMTIHGDRLSDLGENKHVVCVDMKAANGAIYDIDFFITVYSGTLSVTEASVHKVNGKPLYDWKEEGGIFKKVKV
jgi:hypothetical protein